MNTKIRVMLLVVNYILASTFILFLILFTILNISYVFSVVLALCSFITTAVLQWKFYNAKNHIALKIFYLLTLMLPFPLEKLVEMSIRNKYAFITPRILQLLNDIDLKYHLVFGSFLFAYRNKKFKDNDIDLGVFKSYWQENIYLPLLEQQGFILKQKFFLDNQIREYSFKHKRFHASIDLFVIDEQKPNGIGFDVANNRYATKDRDFKYSLKKYDYHGLKYYAPREADQYLSWLYGQNWTKKDPDYHWFYGSSRAKNKIVENANIKYEKISKSS